MYVFLASILPLTDVHLSLFLAGANDLLTTISNTFTLIEENVRAIINSLILSKLWEHPLVCVIFGWLLGFFPQQRKERKEKLSKIKAARASFECVRITLLTFKGEFLIPYRKDISRILGAYKNRVNKLGLSKLTKSDDFSLNHINVIEQISNEWDKLETPFVFRDALNFYPKSWSEELSFISYHTPEYLITFHIAYEQLLALNQLLVNRSSIIKRYREKSLYEGNRNAEHVRDAIHLDWDFAKNLKRLIEDALNLNQICENHLKAYEKRYFPLSTLFGFKGHFSFKMKTLYDHFMPKQNHFAGYEESINRSIKKRSLVRFVMRKRKG